jgi:hypothetical protein
MHLALTQENGVRVSGGARGSDGNLADLASPNLAACAFDSRLPYSMAIRGIRQTRRALDPELPGSRPGWPALPPCTACGSAFVRRTARFDPGWRLSCARGGMGGRTLPPRTAAAPLAIRGAGSNPVGHSQAVLAQLAEAQVLGTWRSGFESPGRYSGKVNRLGAGLRC